MSRVIQEDVEIIAKDIENLAGKLNGKTLMIAGGAGFLGKYFLHTLNYLNKNVLKEPCKVICVDNFLTGLKNVDMGDHNLIVMHHDIRNPLKIEGDVDYIIHAAGIGSPVFYNRFKIETIDAGTSGTRNMLELTREKSAKSFLFFSSSEVYGDPDPRFIPTPETYNGNVSSIGPRAVYDESKRLGETLCITYFQIYNVPVKIVRPFNVYGPGMRLDDYRVIPNFVANALKGNTIPVYGTGLNTRTFCYVSDAITGFFKVLLSDYNGEVFNVGNQEGEINMSDLAEIVVRIFGNSVKIENKVGPNETYMSADPKRRCPDLTKIKSLLGYNPKVNLEDGVKRFVEWAREEHGLQQKMSN